MKPRIAMPSSVRSVEGKVDHIGVPETYINAILGAGGLPVIIPCQISTTDLYEILINFDGVLLHGGHDVDPRHYGELPHPRLGLIEYERDKIEIPLVKASYEKGLPTLGICRGVQVMNVAMGGTLYQDLPAQHESKVNHRSGPSNEERTELRHNLALEAESKLKAILGTSSIPANSIHHQAVKQIAPGLSATAKSEDGIVEAIEAPTHRFFIGVQCHPELLWESKEIRWQKLFAAFIQAAAAGKRKRKNLHSI